MITQKTCPICKSGYVDKYPQSGFAPRVNHELMPKVFIPAVIVTQYFACQNCGLIFQNPRLSDKELDQFYSQGVYRRTLNLTDKKKDLDEEERAKFDAVIIKKQLSKIERHLDVGASRGFLLREIGASTKVAVETDVKGISIKGIKVYSDMSKVRQKSFDLVTAIHVLEHVSNPVAYLKKMAGLTASSGYLIVEVPTWKSPGGPLRLSHLYHFEPSVLRHLCLEAGLTIVYEEFTPHFLLICRKD